jgi:hypothetical protein
MLTRAFRRLWNAVTLTPLRRAASAVLAVVVVGMAVVGAMTANSLMESCGSPGVFHRGPGNQCTGVTDGSFDFERQLHPVDQAILKENASLAGKTYATVALLLPMTDPDAAMQAEILHDVHGAYTAQYQANHDKARILPYIKLVLANPGLGSAEYKPVVQQLAAMTGAPYNLRAAVGISVSTATTKHEVQWLTGHGIPVVGGAITADDLANAANADEAFPGLARVEPTNQQEADALIAFARAHQSQAILVNDTRTDDDYITTLRSAFKSALRGSPYQADEFTSPADISQDGTTANQFQRIAYAICPTSVKWVYFAGRQVQLRQFINQLSRNCSHKSLTILTGDAGSHLATDPQLDTSELGRQITLDFAAIASPGAWTLRQVPGTGGSKGEYQTFKQYLDQAVGAQAAGHLTDGQTIINYDATLTAVQGIRNAADQTTGTSSLSDVATGWSHLRGVARVDGASGWICLDNAGNPWDKAVPIVQLVDGSTKFVQVAWPDHGHPPDAYCQIPENG